MVKMVVIIEPAKMHEARRIKNIIDSYAKQELMKARPLPQIYAGIQSYSVAKEDNICFETASASIIPWIVGTLPRLISF